jgi:hypothetical protein
MKKSKSDSKHPFQNPIYRQTKVDIFIHIFKSNDSQKKRDHKFNDHAFNWIQLHYPNQPFAPEMMNP